MSLRGKCSFHLICCFIFHLSLTIQVWIIVKKDLLIVSFNFSFDSSKRKIFQFSGGGGGEREVKITKCGSLSVFKYYYSLFIVRFDRADKVLVTTVTCIL